MHLHDVIKIDYVNMGYLPDHPYYLISDKEMFEAFTKEGGFFDDYYPCPSEDLQDAYTALKTCIFDKIADHIDNGTDLPSWVYSYMLMSPVTFESNEADISDICDMANIDYPEPLATFTPLVARTCYNVSEKWLKKIPSKHLDRPPTMFGEAHVIKSLRLDQANIFVENPEKF